MARFWIVCLVAILGLARVVQAQSSLDLDAPFSSGQLTAEDIRHVQAALIFDGSYPGPVTGRWDGATNRSFRDYAEKRHRARPTARHLRLLLDTFDREVARGGWQDMYLPEIGLSLALPLADMALTTQTSDRRVWKDRRGVTQVETIRHASILMRNLHFRLQSDLRPGGAILQRDGSIWVTSGSQRSGARAVIVSHRVQGKWSTVLVSAPASLAPLVARIAALIDLGRTARIDRPQGGYLDRLMGATQQVPPKPAPPTPPRSAPEASPAEDDLLWIEVGTHVSRSRAIADAERFAEEFEFTSVFSQTNGYYAVVIGAVETSKASSVLRGLLREGRIPSTARTSEGTRYKERIWQASDQTGGVARRPRPDPAPRYKATGSGSGFVVNKSGDVVTNDHVVEGCRKLQVGELGLYSVLASDSRRDLAVLRADRPVSVADHARFAALRPEANSDVTVVGFPLPGTLSSIVFSRGAISSMTGLRGDRNQFQISAPVQSGNSGGPVLDASGNVVGVVVSKIDAMRMARQSGEIPQNINFAIKADVTTDFLKRNRVQYSTAPNAAIAPTEIAKRSEKWTVQVLCLN